MKSHGRYHNKNIYWKSTFSGWCQDIQGKGWGWICIVRVTLNGYREEDIRGQTILLLRLCIRRDSPVGFLPHNPSFQEKTKFFDERHPAAILRGVFLGVRD